MASRAVGIRGPIAPRISADEALRRLRAGEPIVFVDARREIDWRQAAEKLPRAVRLTPDSADETLPLIARGRTAIVYCTTFGDASSSAAAAALLRNGCRDVRVLQGGLVAWRLAHGPLEPTQPLHRPAGLSGARRA